MYQFGGAYMSCASCGKNAANTIVRGAVGLTRAALSIDRAADDTVAARRDICRNCEHSTKNPSLINSECNGLTNFSLCRKCSCLIAAKTLIAGEKCPLNLWGN